MEPLKREFLELLDRDVEFRYAIAGYLGLSEILKRLDAIAEEQIKLREEQTKIWEEIRALREEQIKLREEQTKIWEEIEALREEQTKIWEEIEALREEQTKIWEEIGALREEQIKLREEQTKIWEEIRALREGQTKIWEEIKALREEQAKTWMEIAKLWNGQNKLWEEVKMLRVNYERMRKYMLSGFRELSASLGVAFEDHAAAFLMVLLEEMGYPDAKVGRRVLAYGGEAVEINLFCEEPLLVGEATVSVKSAEEAEGEVRKLLERVKIVEEKYSRKPEMIILSVARAPEEAIRVLKRLTKEYGIKLILGKEMEEMLAI